MEVLALLGAEAVQEINEEEGTTSVTRFFPEEPTCGCSQCGPDLDALAEDESEGVLGGVLHTQSHVILPEDEGDLLIELAKNVKGRYFLMPEVAMSDEVVNNAPIFSAIIDNFVEFVKHSSFMDLSESAIFAELSEFPDQLEDGTYVYKLTLTFGPLVQQ